MELMEGRPASGEGRLPREMRTYDFLDGLGIRYYRTDHERADNMEACNVIDAVLGVVICKNLFLCNRQKTAFYLLMMPGDKKFKTKELSRQINSARLSFAEPADMLKHLDIEPGRLLRRPFEGLRHRFAYVRHHRRTGFARLHRHDALRGLALRVQQCLELLYTDQ